MSTNKIENAKQSIDDLEEEIKRLNQQLELGKKELYKVIQYIKLVKNSPVVIPIEKFLHLAKEQTMHQKINEIAIQLPNGSVGKPYNYIFNLEQFRLPELKYFEIRGLKNCGLTYDKASKIISGTPVKQGEFFIKLCYKLTAEEDGYPFLEKEISLTINPDPRSLWKNLPSDKEDKDWKPDEKQQALSIESRRIVAASQRGRSHAQDGKFRDDDFAIYHDEKSKWSIVVVADGAGSAKYSRVGSLLACEEIIHSFKSFMEQQGENLEQAIKDFQESEFNEQNSNLNTLLYKCLAGAAFKAYKQIERKAIENERKIKDYATTLVFSIFKKFDFGWFIASYGVGDSPMGIYIANENPIIMHMPEEGEYSGQTYFLTMPEIFNSGNRISFKVMTDFTAIILMTDGIYDPKFQTQTRLAKSELWTEFWQDIKGQVDFSFENEALSEALLKWLDFWSPGNHDDRTIALIF